MSKYNIEFDDIYKAYTDCRKRKKNKDGAKCFEVNEMYNLLNLMEEINNANYKLRPSICFVVKFPTPREVFCAEFRDRIVQHFVYNELNPFIEKELINDTASCRKNKGTDYAISRVERFVRRETKNYKDEAYYLKGDLSGFFMAIDRNLLLELVYDIINTKYTGKYKEVLLYLTEIIITTDITLSTKRVSPLTDWNLIPQRKTLFGNKNGLAIGNITSQVFANLYLSIFDHWIKSRHRNYERYVDDFIIVDKSKEKLKETLKLAPEILKKRNQKLNFKKTKIQNVKYGIDFLGIKIKLFYSVLSKSRINRMYCTGRKIENKTDFINSANSRKGMFERYHGKNISIRWYMTYPEEMFKGIEMKNMYTFYDNTLKNKKKELIKI